MVSNIACAFCDKQIIANQKIWGNDSFDVLVDNRPTVEGHLLIVSKRGDAIKVEDLTNKENTDLLDARKKTVELFKKVFKTDNYIELTKSGKPAGQTVKHLHVHMMPIQFTKHVWIGQLKVLFKIAFPFLVGRQTGAAFEAMKKPFQDALQESAAAAEKKIA